MFTPRISITRLSQLVIGYMMFAFGWWAFHLWQQNERLFKSETQLLECKYKAANQGVNLTQLHKTTEYGKLVKTRNSGRRMVFAEGLFFTLCLAFGLWVINRSANREVTLARQRRNFLLSITHELKSPIAAMRLVLETLKKHTLSTEQQEKLLSNGVKDSDRLQNLVEDLLLAARLEDKWMPVHEPVQLGDIVQECAESLKLRFPDSNFSIGMEAALPPLMADKAGIVSVVKNLLENAIKYSPSGSKIEFSASRVNGRYQIRVADQGQGIPDAEKKKVFEKFYRVGSEDTRKNTGTGLGLYIVDQVVRAHKGSIEVSNNKPQGTVFTIHI
jgi:signal transduction histidine kinase